MAERCTGSEYHHQTLMIIITVKPSGFPGGFFIIVVNYEMEQTLQVFFSHRNLVFTAKNQYI